MKKLFLLVPVAALVMTACTSESTESVGAGQQPKEISIAPLAYSSTRGGTGAQSGSLDTGYELYVAAYQSTPNAGDYFNGTEFVNFESGRWHGSSSRYWPLQASTLNFLAVTSGPTGTTRTWGETGANYAKKVVVVMDDNSTAQHDMMWAVGQGSVTQPTAGGALVFPDVAMPLKHALALVKFTEKVTSTASGNIKLTSITLNDAKYNGTLTVTSADFETTPDVATTTSVWSDLGSDKDIPVPGWTGSSTALTNTADFSDVGALMIIPQSGVQSFASFTVAYQIKNPDSDTWQNYEYTYIPTTPANRILAQGYQYTYNIIFNLNEIVIAPTVATWTENANGSGAALDITIQ